MSGLSCGIIGLPNVGKSTLFNALTKKASAAASNYPFCTIDPNVGKVPVFDPRLEKLSECSKSGKIIYATSTFVDIAGLVKGAASGEGLGNKFLSNIRETDAILHVVRCFENDEVIHVEGQIDPIADIEVINLELILSDLQMAENSKVKLAKQARSNKELEPVVDALTKVIAHLDKNLAVRSLELTDEEKEHLRPYHFLTNKPTIYVTNISESDVETMNNKYVEQVRAYAEKEGSKIIPICAQLEQELIDLPEAEANEYLESVGLTETGLNRLIKESFSLLGLITFLTTGEVETRAWTIKKETKAPLAAGAIHTDIQNGFIRAEVVSYDDFIECGGRATAKDAGKARLEGKDYIVQDGDVILFFHN